MHEITKTIDAVNATIAAGKRGVLVTAVSTKGSTYRRAGARVVIADNGANNGGGFGLVTGLISGGCVERDLAERIETWIEAGRPQLFTYDTTQTSDILFGMGLGCRGVIEMLIEPFEAGLLPQLVERFAWNGREEVTFVTRFEDRDLLVEKLRPPHAVAIFGNGVDVQPVAALAESLGWTVTIHDPRTLSPDDVRARADQREFDAAVIMTHNFMHDLMLLKALLPSATPYVGLLGPRKRGQELVGEMNDEARKSAGRLRNPIGLDLGGETPEEIALSIVAEIQAVLSKREGQALQGRESSLHERPEHTWA